MNREDIEKLLGGYATDSLTPEERHALFAAALEDQDLFDQLAREESLRQVLRDPGARAELLAALDTPAAPWYRRFARWLGQPAGLTAVAATAATLTVAVFLSYQATRPKAVTVAEVRVPSAPLAPPVGPPAPVPEMLEQKPASAEPKRQPATRRAPPAGIREMAPIGPMAAPPSPPGIAGGVAGGVVGGVIGGVPSSAAGGAVAVPPPAPRQELAKEAEQAGAGRGAAAQQSSVQLDARALFNAAPFESSLSFRQEKATDKRVADSATSPSSGAIAPRLRMAAPRANKVEPVAAITPVPVPHLGLRYRVQRRGPDGEFSAADPGMAFRTADQIRLVFEPNDSGYLYLFERARAGTWRLLASDRIERLASYPVPRTGAMRNDEPGVRQFYAVFSRRADLALEPAAIEARLGGSLLVETPDARFGRDDRAVYAVNTSAVPQSQQVAVAITLTFR
jgi:hypothetical protein